MRTSETTEGEDDDRDKKKKKRRRRRRRRRRTSPTRRRTQEAEYLQQTIQIYGLWWEKKLHTKKKKNEKKRTKKPCHRRTNQNLPLRRRVVRQPPSKHALRRLKSSLLEAFLECTKIVKSYTSTLQLQLRGGRVLNLFIIIPSPLVPL